MQTGHAVSCLMLVNKYREILTCRSIFQGLVHNFTDLITEICQGN